MKTFWKYKLRDFCHFCIGSVLFSSLGIVQYVKGQDLDYYESPFSWRQLRPGLSSASYYFKTTNPIKTEILLFKIDPLLFSLKLITASDLGQSLSDVRQMTKHGQGLLGINANFFDLQGKPLGLIFKDNKLIQKAHTGGRTLSGIFYIKDKMPYLVHHAEDLPDKVSLAFQAGPRLIIKEKPVELSSTDVATRRSGIAITEDNQIIIYLTQLRFPGATLVQIQQMLLDQRLKIKDALNLDGGGSSQLYLNSGLLPPGNEIFISGGDAIPVALVFRE